MLEICKPKAEPAKQNTHRQKPPNPKNPEKEEFGFVYLLREQWYYLLCFKTVRRIFFV